MSVAEVSSLMKRAFVFTFPWCGVIDHLNPNVATINADATVADALMTLAGGGRLVVVSGSSVVIGVVRGEWLRDGAASSIVADNMRVGPTTIRPDEDADAVRNRMTQCNVSSLLITRPTGELLGSFDVE